MKSPVFDCGRIAPCRRRLRRWLGHDSLSHEQRETESTHDPGQRQTIRFAGRPYCGCLVCHAIRPQARMHPAAVPAIRNQITDGRPMTTMNTLPTTKMTPPTLPTTSMDEKLICGD